MVLRSLPGPFLGWLGTLMFLLLMQFLIRYLPELAGKGLPAHVIVELIAYNLAYMLVLAVPMSALLSTLMVFGRLSESNAYAVIKNAGISVLQLLWPLAVVGVMMSGIMLYFNNVILPEANFRAKNLWVDIRHKKPALELEPGRFFEGINDYSILVQEIPTDADAGSSELIDVTIYDYTQSRSRQGVIKATRGRIESLAGGLYADLILEDGEVHRLETRPKSGIKERYEQLAFDRYRLRLDLSDLAFARSSPREGYRSDRTTPTLDMVRYVDSLEASVSEQRRAIRNLVARLAADTTAPEPGGASPPLVPASIEAGGTAGRMLHGLGREERSVVFTAALQRARANKNRIDDAERSIRWERRRADQYRVEIHKKISIALACLIFMLIGAPLGLSIRRGALGTVAALALGIFLFYWVTLVQGEKLADRGMLTPWFGMWVANMVMGVVCGWLMIYITMDLRATPPLRSRLRRWIRTGLRRFS